jgi:hypothetical protein
LVLSLVYCFALLFTGCIVLVLFPRAFARPAVLPHEETEDTIAARTSRSVTFDINEPISSDPLDPEDSAGDAILVGSTTMPNELKNRLNHLKGRISQLRTELVSERALRKRKDRSLIKLARELNRRGGEMESKNRQIVRLAQTITELEKRLGVSRLTLATSGSEDSSCDVSPLPAAVTSRSFAQDIGNTSFHSEITEPTSNLGYSKNFLPEDGPRLPAELSKQSAQLLPPVAHRGPLTAPNFTKHHFIRAIILSVCAYCLYATDCFSKDALCGPVFPGSELFVKEDTRRTARWEAPWWAPRKVKVRAFDVLCRAEHATLAAQDESAVSARKERRRTRLVCADGKLVAYDLIDPAQLVKTADVTTMLPASGTVAKQLWQKRASSVRVGARAIELVNKNGDTIEVIPAPWTI